MKADIDRESSSMRQAQVSTMLSHDCTEPSYPLPQWTQVEGGGCQFFLECSRSELSLGAPVTGWCA